MDFPTDGRPLPCLGLDCTNVVEPLCVCTYPQIWHYKCSVCGWHVDVHTPGTVPIKSAPGKHRTYVRPINCPYDCGELSPTLHHSEAGDTWHYACDVCGFYMDIPFETDDISIPPGEELLNQDVCDLFHAILLSEVIKTLSDQPKKEIQ